MDINTKFIQEGQGYACIELTLHTELWIPYSSSQHTLLLCQALHLLKEHLIITCLIIENHSIHYMIDVSPVTPDDEEELVLQALTTFYQKSSVYLCIKRKATDKSL